MNAFIKKSFCQYVENPGFYHGKVLISTPIIRKNKFQKEVVLIISDDQTRLIGVILNRIFPDFFFHDLQDQFGFSARLSAPPYKENIHYGGHVNIEKGCLLHSTDYASYSTIVLNEDLHLSTTLGVLNDINKHCGPHDFIVTLGHLEWSKDQIQREIQDSIWIVSDPDPYIIFHTPHDNMWERSIKNIGIQPDQLNLYGGHA